MLSTIIFICLAVSHGDIPAPSMHSIQYQVPTRLQDGNLDVSSTADLPLAARDAQEYFWAASEQALASCSSTCFQSVAKVTWRDTQVLCSLWNQYRASARLRHFLSLDASATPASLCQDKTLG